MHAWPAAYDVVAFTEAWRYWFDEDSGKVFCLVEAPDAEAAMKVHQEAHGLVADDITMVQEGA